MNTSDYQTILNRITIELENLRELYDRFHELWEQANESTDSPDWKTKRLYASIIEDFYSGLENIFEKTVRVYEGPFERDRHWHKTLLQRISSAPDKGPNIISEPLFDQLEEYLEFRHRSRNLCFHELDWREMWPLVQRFPDVYQRAEEELARIIHESHELCARMAALNRINIVEGVYYKS